MSDIPFSIFSFIGFLLAIECLYCISKTPGRPWATYILITWILLVNFVSFTDSVIYSADDPSDWWDGKGYCDVVSRIKTEFPIGVCGAAIGISRFLAEATDPDPKQTDMRYNRTKRNIIDILLGVALPIINAALRYLVEPSRYYIMGVNGCSSITRTTWPAIPIYFLWVPIMTLIAAVYASIFVWHWHQRRQRHNNNWAAGMRTGISPADFFRLIFTVMTLVLLYLPLSIFRFVSYLKADTISSYSFSAIHGPYWGLIIKISVPKADWTLWISYFGLALSCFFLFGIPRNAKPYLERSIEFVYDRAPSKLQPKLSYMGKIADKCKVRRKEQSLAVRDDRTTMSTEPMTRGRAPKHWFDSDLDEKSLYSSDGATLGRGEEV